MKKIIYFPLCLLLFLFATACSQTPELPEPTEEELAAIAKRTTDLMSSYRQSIIKGRFGYSEEAYKIALQHSQNMATGKTAFGHDGFKERVKVIKSRVTSVFIVAENVAMVKGYEDPAQVAFDVWMASPKHKEIIVGNYDFSAIAVARASDGTYYLTQLVFKRLY